KIRVQENLLVSLKRGARRKWHRECHGIVMRPGNSPGIRAAVLLAAAFATQLCGQIHLLGVTTSAGFATGMPGPGSLATIFCTGLTGIHGALGADQVPLPTQIAGVRVIYGDAFEAPLLAVADLGTYQIVNFEVPWESHPGPPVLSQGGSTTLIQAD